MVKYLQKLIGQTRIFLSSRGRLQRLCNSGLLIALVLLATLAALGVGRALHVTKETAPEPVSVGQFDGLRTAAVPDAAFERGDTIVVGVSDSFNILNPLFSFSDGESDAVSLIFEPLLRTGPDGMPVGCLARDWEYDAENRELIFQLRLNHIFPDGRPVQADDVIFTYECLLADSYNGPLRGRFSSVLAVRKGEGSDVVVFELSDTLSGPDYNLFTVGILKADHYPIDLNRVFELPEQAIPPVGSGSFQVVEMQPDQLTLTRRPGYGGDVRTIIFRRTASDEKLRLLLDGQIDIVRNNWDIRMKQRASSLGGYTLHHVSSRIDSYFLVNPTLKTGNIIQLPSQRLAILLTVADHDLSNLQQNALEDLSGRTLTLYFFEGLDTVVLAQNKATAETVANRLTDAGLNVSLTGLDWPSLAQRAANQDYDILILPVTANNRLPENTVLLSEPVHPAANAWEMTRREEVYIVSNRLDQLTINPCGQPLTYMGSTWTDRIENIRILGRNDTPLEVNQP